jgi:cystathionine beta-lyase/cystathionine gamma-synthase
VLSVIDTFASPINQQPLALGVDLAMQSVTIPQRTATSPAGWSGPKRWSRRLKARRQVGTVMDPYLPRSGAPDAAAARRPRNANARAVADFLAADRRVNRVYYPGCRRTPTTRSPGARCPGSAADAFDLDGRSIAPSGSTLDVSAPPASAASSLINMPVITSQWGRSDEQPKRPATKDAAAVGRSRRRRRFDHRSRSALS